MRTLITQEDAKAYQDPFIIQFETLLSLVDDPYFDLHKTLAHLDLMRQSIPPDTLRFYLNHWTAKSPYLHHGDTKPLKIIPYMMVSQAYWHASPLHRGMLDSGPPEHHHGMNLNDLYQLIDIMLSLDVDIDIIAPSFSYFSPLSLAALHHNLDLLTFLIDRGADVNLINDEAEQFHPLFFAARRNHLEMAKLLLLRGANPNCTKFPGSAIGASISHGHADLLELILNHGGDVNLVDRRQEPLMSKTVRYNSDLTPSVSVQMISLLMAHGADVNKQDLEGFCALHWASTNGQLQAVKHLLSHQASLNLRNQEGHTELHLAAMGKTLGHYPSLVETLPVVSLLISAGSDLSMVNDQGQTPYDVAVLHDNHVVADYLKAAKLAQEERMMLESLLLSPMEPHELQEIDSADQASSINNVDLKKLAL